MKRTIRHRNPEDIWADVDDEDTWMDEESWIDEDIPEDEIEAALADDAITPNEQGFIRGFRKRRDRPAHV